jgi:hypothetical protein
MLLLWNMRGLLEGEPEGGGGGGGGSPTPAWHESIISKGDDGSERLADPASWLDTAPKPLSEFIKSNMTAARSKTEGMVKVPGEGATAEELQAFYAALGVPEKPEEYGIAKPDEMPEGVLWDDNLNASFMTKAKELGLTKAQAQGLAKFQLEHVAGSVQANREAMNQVLAKEKAELDKTFGSELDKVVTSVKAAMTTNPKLAELGIPAEAFDPTHQDFWGPAALKLVNSLVAMTGEHTTHRGDGGQVGASMTVAEAQKVMGDKSHPLHAKYKAGDPEVAKKISDAYAKGV